jgi:hypothetical protein
MSPVIAGRLLLTSGMATGQSSKLSKDLRNLPSKTAVNVVIQYYNPPSSTDTNYAKSVGASVGKALGLITGNGYGAMSPTGAAKSPPHFNNWSGDERNAKAAGGQNPNR